MAAKWIGAVLLTVSGSCLGFEYANVFHKRYIWYVRLCEFLQLLAQEIQYGHALLEECFEEMLPLTEDFFQNLCSGMLEELQKQDGLAVSEIWIKRVDEIANSAVCNQRDLEELKEFGTWLGASRLDIQLDYILKYRKRVEYKRDELLQMLPAQKKMCRSLGICGGLFLTIVLL